MDLSQPRKKSVRTSSRKVPKIELYQAEKIIGNGSFGVVYKAD